MKHDGALTPHLSDQDLPQSAICRFCGKYAPDPAFDGNLPYHRYHLPKPVEGKSDFNERALPGWSTVAVCAKCGQPVPDGIFWKGQPHHRTCALQSGYRA
jgi:hypothetical protein